MNDIVRKALDLLERKLFLEEEQKNRNLLEGFEKYILKKYSSYFKEAISEEFLSSIQMEVLIENCEKWSKLSTEEKEMMFVVDSNYEVIQKLSSTIFSYAINTYHKDFQNINKIELEKIKVQAEEAFEKVKSYNKENAQQLLSELTVDINYITGVNNNISLRLNRFIQDEKLRLEQTSKIPIIK